MVLVARWCLAARRARRCGRGVWCVKRLVLGRPGNDLLSRVLRHSTIGAEEFNGRVRDGIGFGLLAQITGPAKDKGKQMDGRPRAPDPKVREPERASALMRQVFLR